MVQVRARLMTVSMVLAATAAIIAWTLGAPRTAPAADAATMLPTQTLYLTERLTPAGPQVNHDGSVLPENLVALKGEREGFQIAVNNTSGGAVALGAQFSTDAALAGPYTAGQISFELLRVGFVNVPQGSTRLRTAAGMYADPLPPIVNESTAGRLNIAAGAWGGLAVIAKVRTDAPAGTYAANLEMFTGDQGPNATTHVRVPFTLTVGNTRLLQVGEAKSFKTVMNVEGDAYWLQHPDLRNRPKGTDAWADRMAQLEGLMSFLDTRNITPLELPFANPAPTGAYSCSYTDKGLTARSFLSQMRDRYFAGSRDIDPSAAKYPVRMAPTQTYGCITSYDQRGAPVSFHGTLDKFRTPGVKQDDVYNPAASAFFRRVNGTWSQHGIFRRGATYVKSPFDEPGEASARQKATMKFEVPKANVALHQAFRSRAKVVLAAWPRDSRGKRVCRIVAGGSKRCTNLTGDGFDNRTMWDGRGLDDVDVWMPHFSRIFGRTTPARVARDYKVNRTRDYANRLAGIRRKGKETWVYNFYTASTVMPQVTIDAPGTDPRLQYLMLAREGHTGLFISNLMMGWGSTATHPGSSLRRKGDPYEQALYFKHPLYGYAAGWGTFLYPGYVPALGLDGEARRNTPAATPVSSLRLEALRDGTEDANLIQTYRAAKGNAALQAKLRSIFPGAMVNLPSTLGNVVGPRYDNGNMLAMRMERVRREMIAELG